jgi:hypothetical protein
VDQDPELFQSAVSVFLFDPSAIQDGVDRRIGKFDVHKHIQGQEVFCKVIFINSIAVFNRTFFQRLPSDDKDNTFSRTME